MRIINVIGFSPYWGRLPVNILDLEDGPSCGGGEEAGLEIGAGLRALGHDVVTYWYGDKGVWRGVEFRTLQDALYSVIASEHWDAVIGWSTLRPFLYAQPGVKRIFAQQLNDLSVAGDFNRCDVVVSPSANHAAMIYGWGWRGKRAVVHNGLDILRYHHESTPWAQRPYDVGHWSSPDRGLHHLLRAWPLIKKAEPRARLHVGYEIKRYLEMAAVGQNSYFAQRGREIGQLIRDREGDDSVVFHGEIPRKKLAKIQKQCRVMCFPFDPIAYTEGFSIATAQGIAAGCLAMTTPKDALPSLYGDSVYWLKKSVTDVDFSDWLAGEVVKGLHGDLPGQEAILADAAKNADRYTWKKSSLQMEAVCRGENWVEGPP